MARLCDLAKGAGADAFHGRAARSGLSIPLREDGEMWIAVLALIAALGSASAEAQPRPSTVAMTCPQAAHLVAARGAIVLGTGGFTFDRFVGFVRSTRQPSRRGCRPPIGPSA